MLYPYEHQWYRDTNNPDAYHSPTKGFYRGACNRTDCQAPNSAHWYNQSTRQFYCIACAQLINEEISVRELEQLQYDTAGLCVCEYSSQHPFTVGTTQATRREPYIQLDCDLLKKPTRYKTFKQFVDTGNRSGLIAYLVNEYEADIYQWGNDKVDIIKNYVCTIMCNAYIGTFSESSVLEDNRDVISLLRYLLNSPHGIYIPPKIYTMLKLTNMSIQNPEQSFCWGDRSRMSYERDGGPSAFLNSVQQIHHSLFKKESVQRAAVRSLLARYNMYFKNVSAIGF